MDDGGIVGDVELLKQVWEVLKVRGPALGLHLNPSKCEWSWLDPTCSLPCPIRLGGVSEENQVKLVPHSEIQMLGVPLGDDTFVSGFVSKKLLGRLSETVEKLVGFEDSQAASYLLRVSYSIVRAVHFMRTTPLAQWRKQGEEFDEMVCDAAGRILGYPLDARTFAQAALTPKLGGLGLRRSVEHAGFAYSASWHESRVQAREEWVRPDQVGEVHVRQADASFSFDEEMHQYLVDSAPNEREKQRLLRVARPHAGTFVTAVPSEDDGKDCLLKPRLYRIAVAYRLGLPVLGNEISCPLCMQLINVYGDHATCCAKNGDLVVRHNALRNLVYSIASDGLLKPVLEKQGILGPTTGRRPGDVAIPDWKHHNGLAIDVAVTSPLTKQGLRLVSPCENYAAVQKHRKYDVGFKGASFFFCAMIFETLGAINDEGEAVLRQLFTFAAKHRGREFTSYCSRGWARVSCCLQRSVAQVIANRIDGRPDEPVPEAESWVVSEGCLDAVAVAERGLGPTGEPVTRESDRKPTGGPLKSERVESVVSPPLTPSLMIPLGSGEEKMVGGERQEAAANQNNGVSKHRELESVKASFLGTGRREGGPIHSENTTDIDFNRLGAKTQGPGTPAGVLGSAKGIAQVSVTPGVSESAKPMGARHYKHNRGETSNKVSYISSPRNGRAGSRSPHTHTVTNTKHQHVADALAAAPQHSKRVVVRNPVTEEGRIV